MLQKQSVGISSDRCPAFTSTETPYFFFISLKMLETRYVQIHLSGIFYPGQLVAGKNFSDPVNRKINIIYNIIISSKEQLIIANT